MISNQFEVVTWECPKCGETNTFARHKNRRVRPRGVACDHCEYTTRYLQE